MCCCRNKCNWARLELCDADCQTGQEGQTRASFVRDRITDYGSVERWVETIMRTLNQVPTLPANSSSRKDGGRLREEWYVWTGLEHLIVCRYEGGGWLILHRELALGSGLHENKWLAFDHFRTRLTELCEAMRNTDCQAD